MQLAIDRWAINATVPISDLDFTALLDYFIAEASLLGFPVVATRATLAQLELSDPPTYLSLVNNITKWLGTSESYAPQTIEYLPFPTFAFSSRPFYALLIPLFAFFFLFTVRRFSLRLL